MRWHQLDHMHQTVHLANIGPILPMLLIGYWCHSASISFFHSVDQQTKHLPFITPCSILQWWCPWFSRHICEGVQGVGGGKMQLLQQLQWQQAARSSSHPAGGRVARTVQQENTWQCDGQGWATKITICSAFSLTVKKFWRLYLCRAVLGN